MTRYELKYEIAFAVQALEDAGSIDDDTVYLESVWQCMPQWIKDEMTYNEFAAYIFHMLEGAVNDD